MADRKDELRNRVEARKHELQARISHLKADGQSRYRDEIDRLEGTLKQINEAVSERWDKMSDSVAHQLNKLLGREDKK